jgi:hypothetical protein
MTPEDPVAQQLGDVLGSLLVWVRQAAIRLKAQEMLIRQRMSVSDEEWRAAIQRAKESLPDVEADDAPPAAMVVAFFRALSGS